MNEQEKKDAAVAALMKTGGNVQEAAALLGIPLRTFYRGLHRWGLMSQVGQVGTRQAALSASVPPLPVAGGKVDTVACEKDVAGVPQVDDAKEISLDSIRAERRLALSEMSVEPIQVQAQRGRPASIAKALRAFFGADRWKNFEQLAIDRSGQTREWTAPEHIILLAVDLGMPEILRAVKQSAEEKANPKKDDKR